MTREEEIADIVSTYVCKYTCATMADWTREIIAEKAEADDWLFTKINQLSITKEELKAAIEKYEAECKENGVACAYSGDLFSTKFFRD